MSKSKYEVLRENEIRPDHLTKGQKERFMSDIKRLLKHKDEFVYVSCPACGSDVPSKIFEKYGLTYVICSNCETMYVNPRPTPDILEMYYSTSENYWYWNKYIFPASENARREKIFRPRMKQLVEICRKHKIPMDTLMEVGAGFGTFCEELQRSGLFKRIIAVEPTPDLAKTCRKKGLEVIDKPIEQVRFGRETIDVIATFEMIEHLFSPREFLTSCISLLKKGGVIIITCPNVKGFDVAVLQDLSDTVDVEHLNYFHPNSLSQLVNECGFEVLEVFTPGKLDAELVRKSALNSKFDLSKRPFLKTLLIDEWERAGNSFQEFLANNRLSSHMWLVGRKRG